MKTKNKPVKYKLVKKTTTDNIDKAYYFWPIAFFIVFITFAVYLSSLQNGFVNWDDNIYVYENRHIQTIDFEFFKWIFTVGANPTWHPLTLFSIGVDYAIWGLNPAGYHLTNITIHSVNTLLVFLLVIKLIEQKTNLTKKAVIAGGVTALLFGIHPLHVESVAWTAERKDVLYSLFFLLSVIVYLRYLSSNLKRYYLLSLIFFILSLLSKPMAVSLPIVLLLIDFYPLNRLKGEEGLYKKILIEKLPFLVLSFLTALMAIWAQQSGEALSSLEELPFVDRSFISIRAYIFYLVKMVLPLDLAPFYPYTKPAYFTYEYIGSLILLSAITLFVLFKKNRLYSVIWLYYIVTLFPVIGIIKVGAFAAADRYTYLPSIGPFLLAGLGTAQVFDLCSKRWPRIAIIVALSFSLSIFIGLTVRQIGIWQDSMTLWSHEIQLYAKTSNSGSQRSLIFAYNNRGIAYYNLGKYEKAINDYSMVIESNPQYAKAYNNRGRAYYSLGNYEEAIKDYSMAIEFDPRFAETYNNRGLAYYSSGKYEEAINDYSMAIESNPQYVEAHNNRGVAYYGSGKAQQAIADFNRSVELNHRYSKAYQNLGMIYSNSGDTEKARFYYDKAASSMQQGL